MQQLPDYNMQPPEYPEEPDCLCVDENNCDFCDVGECECERHIEECSLCGFKSCQCGAMYDSMMDDRYM